jgi:Flp pilus assembly protein TadG
MNSIRRLASDLHGNVAVIFALALVPTLLAVGAAVDYARAMSAQTALQNAADAAVLAAGASDKITDAEITALVNQFLAGNNYDVRLKAVDAVTVTTTATGGIKVHVAGDVGTTFMALAGFTTLDISANSGVIRGAGAAPLELALVLDTTKSMEGTKIDDLKTAAKNLANTVLSSSTDAKVGVVPFSYYVNVGIANRNQPWMNTPADYTVPGGTYVEYPDKTGCTVTYGTCYSDGVPYSCSTGETCTSWGDPVTKQWGDYTYKFWGCVGMRPAPDTDVLDNALSDRYPGLLDTSCANELTDLTASKADITTAIDALGPWGETFIPNGLIWGWNLLDSAEPFTNSKTAAEITAKGGKKALVLMTDGANTLSITGTAGFVGGCPSGDCSATDTLTSQVCENIKASGIIVYTVLFDVSDAKIEKMLQDCASDPANSYVAADGTALIASFNKIGKSLTSLRLSN